MELSIFHPSVTTLIALGVLALVTYIFYHIGWLKKPVAIAIGIIAVLIALFV